jgi:hypothetical protein
LDASGSAIFGRYSPGAVQQEVRFEIVIAETEEKKFKNIYIRLETYITHLLEFGQKV